MLALMAMLILTVTSNSSVVRLSVHVICTIYAIIPTFLKCFILSHRTANNQAFFGITSRYLIYLLLFSEVNAFLFQIDKIEISVQRYHISWYDVYRWFNIFFIFQCIAYGVKYIFLIF